ncbi:MAG: chromate efflux transporter [Anaerolineae bacterium]|nr:chromate efflux transporter [Anaerolineae bacterium]
MDNLPSSRPLREVILLFLRLGFTAFGGPAAHIALMHDEVVKRRGWVSEQGFLDVLGATNLIPGPNSTELSIHLGFIRAGWAGLLAAGACFISPAALIVIGLAWAYVEFGSTPAVGALLYGIKPVVIAVILQALAALVPKAMRGWPLALLGAAALALYFLRVDNVLLIFGAGLLVVLVTGLQRAGASETSTPLVWWLPLASAGIAAQPAAAPFGLATLFLTFLKIGSVLYGSGYTLLAFLQRDLVDRLGWLTQQQVLDAIAIGQVTPGPVFTTATFIGYVVGAPHGLALPGALLATLGIFLPSFIFVAITNPLIPKLRNNRWTAAFLDGVNASALGLMAAVTIQLGISAFRTDPAFTPFPTLPVDPLAVLIGLGAAVALIRYKVNTTWLILGGGALGLLAGLAL